MYFYGLREKLNADKYNSYCEKSVSRTGLHILIKPSADKFETLTGTKNAVKFFDEKRNNDSPKLEIFYNTKGRYVLLTGELFDCNKGAKIPQAKTADDLLQTILDGIQRENNIIDRQNNNIFEVESVGNTDNTTEIQNNITRADAIEKKTSAEFYSQIEFYNDFDKAEIKAMFESIEVANLPSYNYWLAFMSCCKNLGFSYSEVDAKNAGDSTRYNARKNLATWEGLKNPSFDVITFRGLATKFGSFSAQKFKEEYKKNHKDFAENKIFNNPAERDEVIPKDKNDFFFQSPSDDKYNAERILILNGDYIRFAGDSKKWFTFDKKNHVWSDGGKEISAVMPFAKEVVDLVDKKVRGGKLSKDWHKRKTFSNAIQMLTSYREIYINEQQDLNTHKNLIQCKNGVVNLETGELLPHDPKLLITQSVNAEFVQNCPKNEIVDKFFCDILPDEETRNALLRYLGYCLTGETRAEKALFIHGEGGNGKGTLTTLLNSLFNDYSCSFPIESILRQSITKDGDNATPAFNKLIFKRLAVAEEIPQGRKLDYAKFKILTGGDTLPIRKLHQEATDFKNPTQKFIFSGNFLPELSDTKDKGILRRWIQIKFEQDFTGDKCDENLKAKLQSSESLNYFFRLLVKQAGEWYKNGLIISEKMKLDREEYFAENDFIAEFVKENCVFKEGSNTPLKSILKHLREEYTRETNTISDKYLQKILKKEIEKIESVICKRMNKGTICINLVVAGVENIETKDLIK